MTFLKVASSSVETKYVQPVTIVWMKQVVQNHVQSVHTPMLPEKQAKIHVVCVQQENTVIQLQWPMAKRHQIVVKGIIS